MLRGDLEQAGDVSPRQLSVSELVIYLRMCLYLNELVCVRRPCRPDTLVMDEALRRWAVKEADSGTQG